MSFVEEHERNAGRRRLAGCGCALVGVVALLIFAVAAFVLTFAIAARILRTATQPATVSSVTS